MAWDIEKVSDTVKKNPTLFIVGGGAVVLLVLLLARSRGTGQTYYAEMPSVPEQTGVSGSDLSQLAAEMLYGFSEISAEQQEQFQAAMQDLQMGQIALYGSMQESIVSLQKEQTSLFSSMQDSIISIQKEQTSLFRSMQETFDDILDKTISYQQKQLQEIAENKYYYPSSSGGGGSSSGSSKSSSSSTSSDSKNSGGYAYIDKYGFSHVVSSRETAEQYAAPGTTISEYGGSFYGGYARDEQGERVSLGGVPYGN